ncbi:hypothetical protein [uncultured Rothia sp.]|uniref:hypothetical protein n=1 Tax=uncultured Rothia sp. TaxID=316088 RepID=UPI0025F35A95|nr:hypothetical protein [uncultured Rothia sp.]
MNWNDPRKALPGEPPSQEKRIDAKAFREVRQLVRDISREMEFRSTKASIAVGHDGYVKEITIEGFVV